METEFLQLLLHQKFAGSDKEAETLRFIFECRNWKSPLSGSLLARMMEDKGGVTTTASRCNAIRQKMTDIANDGWKEKYVFSLPPQRRGGGYRIVATINPKWYMPPIYAFWSAHLQREETVAVTNEPVVFRDDKKKIIIRYADVNSANPVAALAKLQKKRPEDQWIDAQNPSYLFAFAGEIGAVDAVREWCAEEGHKVRRVVRNRVSDDEEKGSLLLLGNNRTSRIVRQALSTEKIAKLPYSARVEETVGGRSYIEVRNPTEPEKQAIRKKADKKFSISSNSMRFLKGQLVSMEIEPDRVEWPGQTEEDDEETWRLMDKPGLVAFGIVCRYRGQHGNPVTVVASDYSRAIEAITVALTDEQWLEEVLKDIGWNTGRPVPETFQWLVSVTLGDDVKADMKVKGLPTFICCAEPR
jgi:hypothetical protein